MNKLLIATTNPAKLDEIKQFLSSVHVECVSLSDVGITDRAPEDADTFEDNAIAKAKFYMSKSGMATIADDGGFEIDALGGAPGVRSHRWVDPTRESTDDELISYTIEKMRDIPEGHRGAGLRVVIALAVPDGRIHTTTASVRGVVASKPSGKHAKGFPFRAVLFIPELNKYYDQDDMTEEEMEQYNHRKKAVNDLIPIIEKL